MSPNNSSRSFSRVTRGSLSRSPSTPRRAGYRVRGTVNRRRFESAAVSRARRFFVLVTDEMQKRGRLRSGSTVRVSLSRVPEAAGG